MNCELSYHQMENGSVRVDAKMSCGKAFEGVAIVHEPDSPNPGLETRGCLGFNAVQMILTQVQATRVDFMAAVESGVNQWLPACGGTEQPFQTRSGRILLYCYNPAEDRHAYLDCGKDRILTNEEAEEALGR